MTETGTPFAETLRKLAEEDPDHPAVTCAGVTLTRRQLLEGAQRLAQHWVDLGVGQDDLVTIALPNSVEWAQAAFATWWVGATPQPISPRLPSAERQAIVDLASPRLVVGLPDGEIGDRRSLSVDELRAVVTNGKPIPNPPRIAQVWKAVTSGGSTGCPKLILAVQPAVSESVLPLAELLRLPVGGTILVTAPMTHNSPFVLLLAGLLLGSHVILMPRFDAQETLHLVRQHRVQWLYLVPTMMHRIWRLPEQERAKLDPSSLEVVFHMASPCARWLKQAWIDWLGPDCILELYGGTEVQALTVISGREWLERPGSVGRPVLGEVECRDPAGNRVPNGVVGELWLRRGPGEPRPYRYVGATARSDADGWDSLGDHGYIDDEGYVFITDREADMILVGGANVYPAELEAALDEHPAVRSSCVVGLPDDDLGNVPHAIVELTRPVDDSELLAHLRERIAAHKLPRSFERVDTPLRDDAGKVRRSALRAERVKPPAGSYA
jgi:bile acid-coenzyme A ligase